MSGGSHTAHLYVPGPAVLCVPRARVPLTGAKSCPNLRAAREEASPAMDPEEAEWSAVSALHGVCGLGHF